MIALFQRVNPSRTDTSTLLDFDDLHDRPLCSSTVLALKVLMVNLLRMTTLAFSLASRLALYLSTVLVVFIAVQAFLDWAEWYREKLEMQEEEGTEEQFELGTEVTEEKIELGAEVWDLLRGDAEDEQFDDSISAASHQANRSLSTTPVPELDEQLQELHRRKAKYVVS